MFLCWDYCVYFCGAVIWLWEPSTAWRQFCICSQECGPCTPASLDTPVGLVSLVKAHGWAPDTGGVRVALATVSIVTGHLGTKVSGSFSCWFTPMSICVISLELVWWSRNLAYHRPQFSWNVFQIRVGRNARPSILCAEIQRSLFFITDKERHLV